MNPRSLLASLLLVGCAGSQPPAQDPSDSKRAAPSVATEAPSVDTMRPALRDLFCKPGGLARNCFQIPDDAACKEAFDAAWPECTHDIVLHAGPNEGDHEAGVRAGKCIGRSIGTKFPPTGSSACKN